MRRAREPALAITARQTSTWKDQGTPLLGNSLATHSRHARGQTSAGRVRFFEMMDTHVERNLDHGTDSVDPQAGDQDGSSDSARRDVGTENAINSEGRHLSTRAERRWSMSKGALSYVLQRTPGLKLTGPRRSSPGAGSPMARWSSTILPALTSCTTGMRGLRLACPGIWGRGYAASGPWERWARPRNRGEQNRCQDHAGAV